MCVAFAYGSMISQSPPRSRRRHRTFASQKQSMTIPLARYSVLPIYRFPQSEHSAANLRTRFPRWKPSSPTPTSRRRVKSNLFEMSSQKPITAYPSVELKPQDQEGGPGLDSKLAPAANFTQLEFWTDDGKPYLQEYEGRGLLKDKAALITGGDSGIGRSVAILMAKEGAHITFVYLPEEEEDAQYTKAQIEKAGRRANLLTVDLKEEENCKKAVDSHMEAFGKLSVLVNNSMFHRVKNQAREANVFVAHRRYARNLRGLARHRLVSGREDLPHKHSVHVCTHKVRPAAHEARLFHRQLGLCRSIYGQPTASRLLVNKRRHHNLYTGACTTTSQARNPGQRRGTWHHLDAAPTCYEGSTKGGHEGPWCRRGAFEPPGYAC